MLIILFLFLVNINTVYSLPQNLTFKFYTNLDSCENDKISVLEDSRIFNTNCDCINNRNCKNELKNNFFDNINFSNYNYSLISLNSCKSINNSICYKCNNLYLKIKYVFSRKKCFDKFLKYFLVFVTSLFVGIILGGCLYLTTVYIRNH